jgi:hypothetical protein
VINIPTRFRTVGEKTNAAVALASHQLLFVWDDDDIYSTTTYDIKPEDIYYLYRWNGTGSYHISEFGPLKQGENVGHHEVDSFVQQRARRGVISRGRIPLQPGWKTDYRQLVSSYIATLAEQ